MKKPNKKIIYVASCVVGLGVFAWGFNAGVVALNKLGDTPVVTSVAQPTEKISNAITPVKVNTPVVKAVRTTNNKVSAKIEPKATANTEYVAETPTQTISNPNQVATSTATQTANSTAPTNLLPDFNITVPKIIPIKKMVLDETAADFPTVYINNSRYSVTYSASTSSINFDVSGAKDAQVVSNTLVNGQLYIGNGDSIAIKSKSGDKAYTDIYIQPKGENTSYVYTNNTIIK